ncbi:MAG: SpoIIE family protein phosphatase [Anaerolineales bacterium]|nr:SpoIIE family protein phosphatase [Anaerolineales bacterium]
MTEEPEDRLTTLYRISQTFNSSLDLDDVLNLVMDEIVSVTSAERGFLMLREDDGHLAVKVARGLDRKTIESPEFEVSRGIVDRVVTECKAILTSDAQADEWLGQRKSVRGLKLRSVLGVPLQLKGECIGVVYVDSRIQTGIFSKEDIELLEGIASSAAIAIENARLYKVAIEKGRLERELQVAREVQMNLIPRSVPKLPGWEFAAWWQPARQVSGDFYDFIPLNETQLGIVIADVTDKGMPAALFMANSRSIIRASVSIPTQPANAIASANRLICADSANGMFVSLFYGKLDIESGNLTYVNAGHNPPYLYQAELDTFSEFERTGLVLGIESEAEFKEQAVQLKQGDFILLYTDGVTEATNTEQDLYGKDRLLQLLYNHRKSSVNEVQAALEDSITEFIGDISPSDDITMVIAKRI